MKLLVLDSSPMILITNSTSTIYQVTLNLNVKHPKYKLLLAWINTNYTKRICKIFKYRQGVHIKPIKNRTNTLYQSMF